MEEFYVRNFCVPWYEEKCNVVNSGRSASARLSWIRQLGYSRLYPSRHIGMQKGWPRPLGKDRFASESRGHWSYALGYTRGGKRHKCPSPSIFGWIFCPGSQRYHRELRSVEIIITRKVQFYLDDRYGDTCPPNRRKN